MKNTNYGSEIKRILHEGWWTLMDFDKESCILFKQTPSVLRTASGPLNLKDEFFAHTTNLARLINFDKGE